MYNSQSTRHEQQDPALCAEMAELGVSAGLLEAPFTELEIPLLRAGKILILQSARIICKQDRFA
jgi:hypothetical protein